MFKINKKAMQIFLAILFLVSSVFSLCFVKHVETIMAAEAETVGQAENSNAAIIAYEVPIEEIRKTYEDGTEQTGMSPADSVRMGAKTFDSMSTQAEVYLYICSIMALVMLLAGRRPDRQGCCRERR